jgi:hypothetical protein
MPVRSPRLTVAAAAATAVALLAGAAASAADPQPAARASTPADGVELPALQPGLWEYRRTLAHGQAAKPQTATLRKCTDPRAEIRDKMTELRKKNCQFTPLTKRGDRYLSSWTCPTPYGPSRFRDVLIVKDAGSYQDLIEMRSGTQTSEQRIDARRLGECPARDAGPSQPPASKK